MNKDKKNFNPMDKNGLGENLPSENKEVKDETLRRAAGQVVDNNEDSMSSGARGHRSFFAI